uniref:Protein tyrosine phosphatase receptor type q isoform 1 n=1 Tax=Ixodes scapularis TaxID=6945 RepID=A0A4D5RIB0_IXOSC
MHSSIFLSANMKRLLLTLLLFERAAYMLAYSFDRTTPGKLGFEEKPFHCPQVNEVRPSTAICNGEHECYQNSQMEENSDICAPEAYLRQQLKITASNITNSSAFLTWTSGFPRTDQRKVPLKLSGYFLTGMSLGHTFQKILEPTLTEYNLSCLKPWTEYNITLRRFYPNNGNTDRPMRIGRAAAVTLRTHAYAPLAPSEIQIISAGQEELNLRIVDPISWNGLPLKYHVRWEPEDPRSGVAGNLELDIPSTRPYDPDGMRVTLSLKPGVRYRLYASAENSAEEHNLTFLGPAIFRVVATIPKDPIGLIVNPLSSGELFVSWSVSGPADFFRVKVASYHENPHFGISFEPNSNRNNYDARRSYVSTTPAPRFLLKRDTIAVDGVGTASVRSVIVNKPQASQNCSVRVEACSSSSGCSNAPTTWVMTKPISTPEPVITGVSSNSTNSFKVTWTFPEDDSSYYDGFLVHYCAKASSCRESYTHKQNLYATNLSAGTSYDIYVYARIKHLDGLVELGPAARAEVSTWKKVPLEPVLEARASEAMSKELVLYWKFINSTVHYLQFTKTEENIWMNCTDDAHCDVAVMHGWTPEFKTGFITLKNLVPYTTYSLSIRGCNDAGCGNNSTLKVRTGIAAPGEPAGLTVQAKTEPHEWKFQNQGGILVTWKRPSVPAGPLSSYIVSWECPKNEKQTKTVGERQLLVQDLPEEGSNCTFWVAGLNRSPEGHLLVGRAANLSLS